MDVSKIIASLSAGAKRACLLATTEWQFPGKATFNANGIWALHHARHAGGRGALVEREKQPCGKHMRDAYKLTPLGLAVHDKLARQRDQQQ